MAIVYFDSSALVKLLVEEDDSDIAAALWDGCDAAVSNRLAYPEVRGGASITVARDGTVFIAAGACAGVGVGAGTPDVSIAAGYVGLANLPKGQRRPTNHQIDSYIDNWTIPVQGYVSGYFGLGAGGALIDSPGASGPKIGEEYQLHAGIGGGVSIQASCAVRLGKIKQLAALSAASVAPGLAEALIHRYLRTLLADAGKAMTDSAVCQRGVTAPSTIMFGSS